jgi:hypothetical protein
VNTAGSLGLLGDSRPILTGALEPTLRAAVPSWPHVTAAYLGAANGDEPQHFALFAAAMNGMGLKDAHHVVDDAAPLERAALIFLAGGNPLLGLGRLRDAGLLARVATRHREGAVVLGSSAGAILLGARVWDGTDRASVVDGARLVPFAMGAHAEPDWTELRALCDIEPGLRGVGLRSGGGVWWSAGVKQAIATGYEEVAP